MVPLKIHGLSLLLSRTACSPLQVRDRMLAEPAKLGQAGFASGKAPDWIYKQEPQEQDAHVVATSVDSQWGPGSPEPEARI